MINIRTLSIAALFFYCVSSSAAGFETNKADSTTMAPDIKLLDLPRGLLFGLKGDFLQPHADHHDLRYAILNDGSKEEIHPDYSLGGGAKLGYIFDNRDNDIKFNYNFLNTKNFSDSVTGSGIQAVDVSSDNGVTFNSASSEANYHIKQADFTLGQYFKPSQTLSVHPMVGVRYAQIKQKKELNYTGGSSSTISSETVDADLKSDFIGAGPLIAVDARLGLTPNQHDGFGIIGYADMGMLIGNINSSFQQTLSSLSLAGLISNSSNSLHDDLHRIIPAFDGSLGIDYRYRFNKNNPNTSHPELIAEIGYEASFYYKAVNSLSPAANTGGTQQTRSSLALIGPFLSLTYRGIPI